MALSETLKQKAGPLPVWAWGVILGVVVVAGMYWYSSKQAVSSAEDPGFAVPDLDGSGGAFSRGSGGGSNVTEASPQEQFSSNLAWETYVIARMTGQGYSPLTVQLALEKYLHGGTLTAAEQTIVNYAITKYGLPPFGTDVTPVFTVPTTVQNLVSTVSGTSTEANVKQARDNTANQSIVETINSGGTIPTTTVIGTTSNVRTQAEVQTALKQNFPVSNGDGSYTFAGVRYTPPTGGYATTDPSTYTVTVYNALGKPVQRITQGGVVSYPSEGDSSGTSVPVTTPATTTPVVSTPVVSTVTPVTPVQRTVTIPTTTYVAPVASPVMTVAPKYDAPLPVKAVSTSIPTATVGTVYAPTGSTVVKTTTNAIVTSSSGTIPTNSSGVTTQTSGYYGSGSGLLSDIAKTSITAKKKTL